MCGRFAQFTPIEDLAEEYEIDQVLCDLKPRYNIAPGQEIAAIIIDENNQTNVPGLFAAGDATDVNAHQVVIAIGEGAKAALNAYTYLLTLKA